MKAVIFAGGVGTRLWPLSRRNTPKQFESVIGDKSTLQLTAERLIPEIPWPDIYISTNAKYAVRTLEQLKNLNKNNIISEPDNRDVGPAVSLITAILHKKDPLEPLLIMWSDHLIKKVSLFLKILKFSKIYITANSEKIIFISQKARFASQNLGWIKFGQPLLKKDGISFKSFAGFIYRPGLDSAREYLKSGLYSWNTGCLVTTPKFLWQMYKIHQPEIFSSMVKLQKAYGSAEYTKVLEAEYPKMPKISFDNAILEMMDKKSGLVISEDLGWSDIGAWEALKEALETAKDKNVIKGKVVVEDSQDSLIYNYTDQLLVTIDLSGHLVVATKDVILVCHKNSVPKIKKLVEKLAETDNRHLI